MKVIEMQRGGGPEVLELAEKPLPEPAAGEVRVRAEAIGISSADMLVRKGVYNWMPPLPAIPGNEMAGVVDALGRDVTDLRLGQWVLVSSRELPCRGGCYAQAICVPASALFLLPQAIARGIHRQSRPARAFRHCRFVRDPRRPHAGCRHLRRAEKTPGQKPGRALLLDPHARSRPCAAARAHEMMEAGRTLGKIILVP